MINNPIFAFREDVCKLLVEVYGADIDIRDFSGKKAFHYLKSHYPEKNFEWVSWISYHLYSHQIGFNEYNQHL